MKTQIFFIKINVKSDAILSCFPIHFTGYGNGWLIAFLTNFFWLDLKYVNWVARRLG